MISVTWRAAALAFALALVSVPAAAQGTAAPAGPEQESAAPVVAPEATATPEGESPAEPTPPADAASTAAPAQTVSSEAARGAPAGLPNIDALVHVPAAAIPKPGERLDVEAATRAYLDELPAEARARSDAYFEGGYVLIVVDLVYGLIVAAILLWGRLSANFRDRAQRITRFKWLQSGIYALQYLIVGTILSLPLIIYDEWYREHEFGLSNQTLPEWAMDYGIQFALSAPFFLVFIILLYALIRWTGSRWWIWGTAMAMVLLAIQVLLVPVYFAPAINKFEPLAQGELRDSILSMARANGVPADNVWRFDASRQHKRISANVSGLLGTTQISLNDNLLKRGSIPEVKAVMAHELGHYVLNHIWELLALFTLLLLIGFGFTHWAATRLIARFGGGWRVSGIDDPAGLPVLLAVLGFLGFVATPITNTIIRTNEVEADIYGLNAAREPDGFAMVALKLSEYRKLDPEPWEEFLFYDHPSGRERIRMAMQWKAEHPNEGAR
jgi:STE24 endopeptidase